MRQWSTIEQSGVRVGAQASTFMETVMRERLHDARPVSMVPPQTRKREWLARRIDVFMTEYPYDHALSQSVDGAVLLALPRPFHVLRYGWASKPGDTQWPTILNAFAARIRQDGRLAAAARRHGLERISAQ